MEPRRRAWQGETIPVLPLGDKEKRRPRRSGEQKKMQQRRPGGESTSLRSRWPTHGRHVLVGSLSSIVVAAVAAVGIQSNATDCEALITMNVLIDTHHCALLASRQAIHCLTAGTTGHPSATTGLSSSFSLPRLTRDASLFSFQLFCNPTIGAKPHTTLSILGAR